MSGSRTSLYGALVIQLLCSALLIESAIAQSGPVYVNPNDPIKKAPVAVAEEKVVVQTAQPEFVTQTVYGFLDFTTTIGSTIMVFSPQSAAPEPVVQPKPSSVVSVVENQPSKATEDAIKATIQPTKSSKMITPTSTMTTFPSVVLPGDPLDVEHVVFKEEERQDDEDEEEEDEEQDSSEHDANEEEDHDEIPLIQSSIVEVLSSESSVDPVLPVANHLVEPEYDFLSRQPSEYVEESFRVVNLKSPQSSPKPANKPKQRVQHTRREDNHPTGLVTKLGGTVVKDGATTVHETSVIGTFINGKYAQVLQSTSQVIANKPKITPTSSLRILKTAAPAIPKKQFNVDPTPSFLDESSGPENLRAKKAPAQNLGALSKNNRFRSRNSKEAYDYADEDYRSAETKKNRSRPGKKRYNRPNKEPEVSTVSVFSETSTPAYTSRRYKNPSRYHDNNNSNRGVEQQPQQQQQQYQQTNTNIHKPELPRRSFKPKVQPAALDHEVYPIKLNRTPGRWQYKTTPKPRVSIRKSTGQTEQDETKLPVINERPDDTVPGEDNDLSSAPSVNGDVLKHDEIGNHVDKPPPVETLKVEISTPADFSDTYFEIATIKTPYIFQAGTVKNTRFITITSTFQKILEPEPSPTPINGPLTENILATTSHIDKEQNLLETTIATLPPLYLESNMETPPLETITETFSTSHIVLKTHILPVITNNNETSSHTLIQTYQVTRLVTATKTLPPAELYNFVPSKRLNEFNSRLDDAGSEYNINFEFGDNNDEDDEGDEEAPHRELPPDLDLSNIGSEFDLDGMDKRRVVVKKTKHTTTPAPPPTAPPTPALSPELQQQLALLKFLNPAAQIPQVVSKPVIKVDTIYDSHVIPIFNGRETILSTISRPVSTVTRTEYALETSALPLPPPIPQFNPLFPQQQQQPIQIQSTPVVTNTVVTQTNSKVLKLTFGAKTAYTTLFSTQVVPTLLTTYITNSVAVQPTAAAFPGYFPAPYGFPYVG